MVYYIYILHLYYIYIQLHIYVCIYLYAEYSTSESFRLCLYQLHIYNKILLQSSNLQIIFSQILMFHYYRNGNTNINKIDKKTVVTKLRETRLAMTYHKLDKSN